MPNNILLTGLPQSGKSTMFKKITTTIDKKVGFFTNEICKNGKRIGFEVQTHLNNTQLLASNENDSEYKVSSYSVDLPGFESILPEVEKFSKNDFLYLDEIGQMEIFSKTFQKLTLKYLNSDNLCFASMTKVYKDDFTEKILTRDDIVIVDITENNRDDVFEKISKKISGIHEKIEKAKNYLKEPERFVINGPEAEMQSIHNKRKLKFQNNHWNCSCDFYKENNTCSHSMALKWLLKINN
jgi:nucleoside-triphosphatase